MYIRFKSFVPYCSTFLLYSTVSVCASIFNTKTLRATYRHPSVLIAVVVVVVAAANSPCLTAGGFSKEKSFQKSGEFNILM